MDKVLIGKKIRQARTAKALTQAQLAELVSMHEKHISKIESGKSIPTYENMIKIFKVLDIELHENEVIVNIPKEQNKTKKEILKLINNATDFELEFYFGILKQTQKGLLKLYNDVLN